MRKSDFHFDLPPELIAQTPLPRRSDSRLLVLPRSGGGASHKKFTDITEFLRPGDCLALNDTRVLPARLAGRKTTGGAAEILLLKRLSETDWEALVKPARRLKPGTVIHLSERAEAEIGEILTDGRRLVRFRFDGVFEEILEALGETPLPPYIKAKLGDPERYQTVYARASGSAAAPTAGLHFTPELLEALRERGVRAAYITLHVGLGTFRPVKEEKIAEHIMHEEEYHISKEAAAAINSAKEAGGRIIPVGTTSLRALESASAGGRVQPGSASTGIFIYPGYSFKMADALITNFHLPESTLLMLVCAMAGRERVMAAYAEAVRERYRFFSFGDAMFIV
ncbi:MAG: tRNA preQ1(34) S-adenosylmethionine ribosyltransferase-isomerase QueA [Clostridiales bacterium]|nr:tRNA preQ1(34) S-adenosylmethionine ribosyltransferase-isomerase QueA [Clostridiales bacterium]